LYTATINGDFWEYGSYTLYASELLLLFLAALSVAYRVMLRTNVREAFLKKAPKNGMLFYATALFSLYLIASNVWSVNHAISLIYTIRFFELIIFVWLLRINKYNIQIAAFCFILGMSIHSGLAIVQFFTQTLPANKWLGIAAQHSNASGVSVVQTFARRFLRGYGGMPHPNILGGWLSVCLCIIIALYHKVKDSSRALLLVAYGGIFTGLILTFSRSAWAGFIAGWIVLIFFLTKTSSLNEWFKGKSDTIALIVLTAAFSIILGLILKEPLTERGSMFFVDVRRNALGYSTLEEKSLNDRKFAVQESREIIKKNPVFGTGIGTYTYDRHIASPKFSAIQLQPVHVVFLLILSELGVIGLILAIMVILLWFRQLFAGKKIIGIMMGVGLLLISFFDHYLWTLSSGMYLVGLVIIFSNVLEEK
jgi:O-antigen ligase